MRVQELEHSPWTQLCLHATFARQLAWYVVCRPHLKTVPHVPSPRTSLAG